MTSRPRTWALILAAGDGSRLATLTRDRCGNTVPKQFCSLAGGHSLVDEALQRARYVVPRERTCAIVAEQHERYWRQALWALPPSNVIAQPRNRGTAIGILLSTLSILERDPLARIVFLPADHYVRDEPALGATLREAAISLMRDPMSLLLIGIEPEEADPELGYIVPGDILGEGVRGVARFVEKPETKLARQLIAQGALWNSFIFAAHGTTLLGLMRQRMPQIVEDMATALARDALLGRGAYALRELYERLPTIDFSRAALQETESRLRLLTAPACGWSDLGTPKRVAEALRRLDREDAPARRARPLRIPAPVNLAAQYASLAIAG